jgi:hypothetical protein
MCTGVQACTQPFALYQLQQEQQQEQGNQQQQCGQQQYSQQQGWVGY